MEETPPQLWLAVPDAAALLVPDGLNSGDRARWERLRGRAKGVEWAASRALRGHVSPPSDAATSLTHSAGHAVLAIGPAGSRVGVDLEAVLPRAVTRLAGFCFAPEEARELEDADEAGALVDFYVRWTLKEAFAKVTGLPLLSALRTCSFSSRGGNWTARVPLAGRWRATVHAPRPGLVLAAVLAGGEAGDGEAWVCREWPPERSARWARLACLSSDAAGNGAADRAAAPRRRRSVGTQVPE
jgi:4'-phosphopantetheinyl transferase